MSAKQAMTDATDNVPVRQVNFHFNPDEMAKYCWKNDPFSSAYILTFSGLIPYGEQLVIDAVRKWRDKVRDPELKARVAGLIGQETMHSKIHQDFNDAYAAKGLPMKQVDRAADWLFNWLVPKVLSDEMQLAVTCAIEHFTAIMAERSFEKPEILDNLDKPTREFLLWHLLEECEHKSVAFDVYQEAIGDPELRRRAMYVIGALAIPVFAYSMARILATPGFSSGIARRRNGLRYWFGRRGYFVRLSPRINKYHHRDFHPDQIETDAMLREWREKLFGEGGELAQYVTHIADPLAAVRARASQK